MCRTLTPPTAHPGEGRDPASKLGFRRISSAPLEPTSEPAVWVPTFAGMSGFCYGAKLDRIFTPHFPFSKFTTYIESKPPITEPSLR